MKTYKVIINLDGTKCWYNAKDQLHREDGPAIEYSNGTKSWYINGKCHREDGPAIEWGNGKAWFINGQYLTEAEWRAQTKQQTCNGKTVLMKTYKVIINLDGTKRWYNAKDQLHREDGPAIEYSDGSKEWWFNGQLHREDGPAIEYSDYKSWYINGKCHREDGPAVEWSDGTKAWYINGQLHREDGPAVEYRGGSKAWWLNGQCLTEAEWLKQKQTCNGKTIVVDGKTYKLVQIYQ